MYLVPDAQVTPSLRLLRPLKEGGVGRVWVCAREPKGVEVAVKFLSDELLRAFPDVLKRFKREAEAALEFEHPNAVRTTDWGTTEDGTPYIVMELLAGESLGERLERAGALSPKDVARVVEQVAAALESAHARGMVHRDIKPDNIFLVDTGGPTRRPYVKVLDFGTIKQRERKDSLVTSTGVVVGTPEYMSPEQVLGSRDVDHRADLWSLAVVAYHGLTGRLPFEGDSPNLLVIDICNARFTPISQVANDLPVGLDGWFQRALTRTPAGRFESAHELAETFAEVVGLGDDGVDDDPTDVAEQTAEEEATLRFRPAIAKDIEESSMRATLRRGTPQVGEPDPPPSSHPMLDEDDDVDDGAATLALDEEDHGALSTDLKAERARLRRRARVQLLVALVAALVAVFTVAIAALLWLANR